MSNLSILGENSFTTINIQKLQLHCFENIIPVPRGANVPSVKPESF